MTGVLDAPTLAGLRPGLAIVYPASTLHCIEPVRSGTRLAAITTIQSLVRGDAERGLLADIVTLSRPIEDRAPANEEVRLAARIRHNLICPWAD